ncbi:sodium-dependent transporter [Roseivirga sp. E12]|uniref:sodium-dependent transporter n=1 Tax=Roseivirga sp. E12 TaxID=2819237 RepID=UPI001ABBFD30|nr:sodium-dependent transporter [Roseivirga sp. E12]MBO3697134.1 sodium-dependent transporter [Roseivirga sp. E12]
MNNTPRFTSKLAAILTMVGVSVGLGNVWRFPYMMGQNGGSAFLFIYLIFTLLFAVPALVSELALGRETRKGPLGTFSGIFGGRIGKWIGYLLLLTVLVADSYYLVVIGNVAFSTYFSVAEGFSPETNVFYQEQLGNGVLQLAITFVILLLSLIVIRLGLKRGIERVSKVLVPFFLVVIVYLTFQTLNLDGVGEKLRVFMMPDISAITIDVVFAGLGQTFFSLGLGGTFLLLYGSYMKKDQDIVSVAISTGIGDMGAAILASLFIIPAILVFNLDMTSGPSLLFNTLPELFSQMPMGRWSGSLFLLALTGIAFLSNIAALEVFANALREQRKVKMSKNQIIWLLGIIEAVLIIPSALNPALIGHLDLIFGSGMQTFGSVISIIGLAWFVKRRKALLQVFGEKSEGKIPSIYFLLIKWVIPAILLFILVSYIYSSIFS